MKDTLKTFKDTQIPNTPYNWHIWKRAYAMGYKESESIKKPKQMKEKQDVSSSNELEVWDDLFGILAWKFKPTKTGDMMIDSEKVYNELKHKFKLKRKHE